MKSTNFAYGALALSVLVAALLALRADGAFLTFTLSPAVLLALVALGAVLGVVAIVRRASPLAIASAALLALALAPDARDLHPGLVGLGAGLVLGGLVLAFVELVHQSSRYDTARRLVEEEEVDATHDAESVAHVTDEALRTLAERGALALGLAAIPVILALALASVGPPAWRAGIETSSTLGVTVLALALFGGISIYILSRGATLRDTTEKQEAVAVAEVEVLE